MHLELDMLVRCATFVVAYCNEDAFCLLDAFPALDAFRMLDAFHLLDAFHELDAVPYITNTLDALLRPRRL